MFVLSTLAVCRMIMCPFGASLLVGMASGGIRRLQIGRENVNTDQPKLVEVSGGAQVLPLLVITAVGSVITVADHQQGGCACGCLHVQAQHSRRAEQSSCAVVEDAAKCWGQQCAQPAVSCSSLVVAAVSSVSQHCWHMWVCQPPQQSVGEIT